MDTTKQIPLILDHGKEIHKQNCIKERITFKSDCFFNVSIMSCYERLQSVEMATLIQLEFYLAIINENKWDLKCFMLLNIPMVRLTFALSFLFLTSVYTVAHSNAPILTFAIRFSVTKIVL